MSNNTGFKKMADEALESTPSSSVEMEALDWLWPNRFALGKVGLIVGLPDEGKGQLLCYMAAQITHVGGGCWPLTRIRR